MKLHYLNRSSPENQSFTVSENKRNHFIKIWHFHKELELVLISKSTGIRFVGDNIGRFDYSTAVWGYDFSVVGTAPDVYPAEPVNGIALDEEFSYEVNVYKGIMYLTFTSENHETVL